MRMHDNRGEWTTLAREYLMCVTRQWLLLTHNQIVRPSQLAPPWDIHRHRKEWSSRLLLLLLLLLQLIGIREEGKQGIFNLTRNFGLSSSFLAHVAQSQVGNLADQQQQMMVVVSGSDEQRERLRLR